MASLREYIKMDDKFKELVDNMIDKQPISLLTRANNRLKFDDDQIGYMLWRTVKVNRMPMFRAVMKLKPSSRALNFALYHTAKYGRIPMAKLLIEAGANDMYTCMIEAIVRENEGYLKFMFDRGGDVYSSFLLASALGNVKIMSLYLSRKRSEVNLDLALLEASRYDRVPAVSLLIKEGATGINAAMLSAAIGGSLRTILYLFSKGASNLEFAKSKAMRENNLDAVTLLDSLM